MESHGDVRVPVADCRCYMNVYGRGMLCGGTYVVCKFGRIRNVFESSFRNCITNFESDIFVDDGRRHFFRAVIKSK